jgi:hypothetical protein
VFTASAAGLNPREKKSNSHASVLFLWIHFNTVTTFALIFQAVSFYCVFPLEDAFLISIMKAMRHSHFVILIIFADEYEPRRYSELMSLKDSLIFFLFTNILRNVDK